MTWTVSFEELDTPSAPGTPTLDQLQVFLTVVDVGSFAGAARRLGRATSVISYSISNLEGQFRGRALRPPADAQTSADRRRPRGPGGRAPGYQWHPRAACRATRPF